MIILGAIYVSLTLLCLLGNSRQEKTGIVTVIKSKILSIRIILTYFTKKLELLNSNLLKAMSHILKKHPTFHPEEMQKSSKCFTILRRRGNFRYTILILIRFWENLVKSQLILIVKMI